MEITPLLPVGMLSIQGYGAGGFTIAGNKIEGSIILARQRWQPVSLAHINTITPEQWREWQAVFESGELILFGTGLATHFPPAHVLADLRARNIAFECMSTANACSTYNVLLGDGRNIAACLIAV